MQFPKAPDQYNAVHQAQVQRIIETEDKRNVKIPDILTAPNGSRWIIVVDNAGALSTVAA